MNNVSLIGNLTRDLELRYVGENKTPITTIGLAVNTRFGKKEETMFIDVDVWGKQAENCCEYLSKGRKVGVTGRLKQESWEDTTTSQKRSKILIVADSVEFLSSGNKHHDDAPVEESVEQPTNEETPF